MYKNLTKQAKLHKKNNNNKTPITKIRCNLTIAYDLPNL